MKRNTSRFNYLIALFVVIGTGTANAQQRSGVDPMGSASLVEAEDLVFMREEEKLARDSYQVFAEQWDLAIFRNIAKSEQRHMDALKVLLDAFGIVDPVIDESDVGTFENPTLQTMFNDLTASGLQSVTEALEVGAAIEETDILDIQDAIERAGNQSIIATYENLLCGSRNHLRAFVGQIELSGAVYVPVLMSGEELDAIVDLPMERGCGNKKQRGGKGAGNGSGNGNRAGKGNGAGNGSGNGNGVGNGSCDGSGIPGESCDGG